MFVLSFNYASCFEHVSWQLTSIYIFTSSTMSSSNSFASLDPVDPTERYGITDYNNKNNFTCSFSGKCFKGAAYEYNI